MSEQTVTITVPDEVMDWIRSQVRCGHFASEDEAVRVGISHLRDEVEFEKAMRSDEVVRVVAERYDEAELNPESLVPIDQVIMNMDERHKKRVNRVL